MKYAVEIVSGAMIYIQSFVKIGSGIQKLKGEGGFPDKYKVLKSYKPTLIFENKGSRVKYKGTCVAVSELHLSVTNTKKQEDIKGVRYDSQ
jgi:hypothetical protein